MKKKYSGKFPLRVKPELHRDLAAEAKKEGVSLNLYVATALARAVGQREGFNYGKWAGTMLERIGRRSANYALKSPQEQWEEDKRLGILDYDGK